MVIRLDMGLNMNHPRILAWRDRKTRDPTEIHKLEEVLDDGCLIEMWRELVGCLKGSRQWVQAEDLFIQTLVKSLREPVDVIKKKLMDQWRGLGEEAEPETNPTLLGLLGLPAVPPGPVLGGGKGRLWETYKGVELRGLDNNFDGTEGVMIGKGTKDIPDSIFTEEVVPKLNQSMVKHMLTGRPWFVTKEQLPWAKRLVDTLGTSGGPGMSAAEWRRGFRRMFSGKASLSLIGVMLKTALLHRPGHLGNFVRSFLCCALETFQKTPVELLPMALPQGTAAEAELIAELTERSWGDNEIGPEERLAWEEKAKDLGAGAWVWLQITTLNALYCGGGTQRMLSDCMLHPKSWTGSQELVVSRQLKMAEKWVEEKDETIELGDWETMAEGLQGIYTGGGVGKSYPLTLKDSGTDASSSN